MIGHKVVNFISIPQHLMYVERETEPTLVLYVVFVVGLVLIEAADQNLILPARPSGGNCHLALKGPQRPH